MKRIFLAVLLMFTCVISAFAQSGVEEPSLYEWGDDASMVSQTDAATCAALSLKDGKLYPRSCTERHYFFCQTGRTLGVVTKRTEWSEAWASCSANGGNFPFPASNAGYASPRTVFEDEFVWVNFKKFYDDHRHRDPLDRRGESWMSNAFTGVQAYQNIPAAVSNCAAIGADGPFSASCSTSMYEACVRDTVSGKREWAVTKQRVSYNSPSRCGDAGLAYRRGVPMNVTELRALQGLVTAQNLTPAWISMNVQDRRKRCVSPETFLLCTAAWTAGTLFWASHALPSNDADSVPVTVVNPTLPRLPWHLAAINLKQQVRIAGDISVAVLDSGVEFSGPLAGSSAGSYNYTSDSLGVSPNASVADRIHGTLMSSIIAIPDTTVEGKPVAGIAPGIRIVDRKITPNGTTSSNGATALAQAIADAATARPDQPCADFGDGDQPFRRT